MGIYAEEQSASLPPVNDRVVAGQTRDICDIQSIVVLTAVARAGR